MSTPPPRVLIVTGPLISPAETDLLGALRKQMATLRESDAVWFDVQIKVLAAERLIAAEQRKRSRGFAGASYADAVRRFDAHDPIGETPELTEVVLATALESEGLAFEVATYSELFADAARRERLLRECACVFASTTLLHDAQEMKQALAMLRAPHNRVVAGGALASLVHPTWEGPEPDVLAVGYGELLVPGLAAWIRSGFQAPIAAPESGRVERRGQTTLLFSGVPDTRDLDFLPSPDWRLAERAHGRRFRMAHYESVRGCPYRCAFCNYPFLFDDTRFRHRSAKKIADDWAELAAMGVEYVTCLDSLFTMPRRRLHELCAILLERDVRVKWICYARADDLADRDTVALMKRAGCHQVQIGIESGSQQILDNMNKQSTVEKNHAGLRNCRAIGLTTLVTVIVGFPGETEATVRDTFEFLRASPPDVFYVAPFSTWAEKVPILSERSRKRFSIATLPGDVPSPAPYWKHATMSCADVGRWMRWLNQRLMEERVALEGFLFYKGLLGFDARDREALLDFQYDVATGHPLLRTLVSGLDALVHRALVRDVERRLAGA